MITDASRKGYAASHRLNRAAAPVLGLSAALGLGFSAYQIDRMESRITARIDRLEDRLDRQAQRAQIVVDPPERLAAR